MCNSGWQYRRSLEDIIKLSQHPHCSYSMVHWERWSQTGLVTALHWKYLQWEIFAVGVATLKTRAASRLWEDWIRKNLTFTFGWHSPRVRVLVRRGILSAHLFPFLWRDTAFHGSVGSLRSLLQPGAFYLQLGNFARSTNCTHMLGGP